MPAEIRRERVYPSDGTGFYQQARPDPQMDKTGLKGGWEQAH
jgi:hypothetical protein